MKKEVLEGEIVGSEQRPKKAKTPQPDSELRFPGWRLALALIPIIGLIFAIAWFYYDKNKKSPSIVFAVIAVIIGIFTTTTFIVLRFILKAIF